MMNNLHQHPKVRAAMGRQQLAEAALAEATREDEQARAALGAFDAQAADGLLNGAGHQGHAQRRGHLEAIEATAARIAIAHQAVSQARAGVADAFEAATMDTQAKYLKQHRAAVLALGAALAKAAEANAKVYQVQQEAAERLNGGTPLEPLHWRELLGGDCRLTQWRRAAGLAGK